MKRLDQVRCVIQQRHYPIWAEEAYAQWLSGLAWFINRHPKDLGEQEIA